MEESNLILDLSDDDEDKVVRTIQLQKSLISESQSFINPRIEVVKCHPLDSEEQIIANDEDATASGAKEDETSYRNALAANVEYDNYLARLETNLKTVISQCKSDLDELANIQKIRKGVKNRFSFSGKSNQVYIFGAPFFKDKDYYPCPPNADTVAKTQNGELSWVDLPTVRWWTPTHTKQLVDAIKQLSLEACKKEALTKKSALIRRCTALGENDTEEKKKLEEEINGFSIDNYVSSHLNEKLATMDHDWLKLSASVLNGRHAAEECRGFWYNYLHPKFYKGSWTDEECDKLKSLVLNNNFQNWDLIAEQLGTRRSGYQCFAQSQSEVVQLSKQRWSDAEDVQLKAMVEKFRVEDYIPWGQVCIHMKNRTKTQVYNRWTYSLNPKIKKGRFTIQEDIIILRGIQKWGEDFQKIASYMPDRMAPQIRTRYHSGISKMNFTPWTSEEDEILLSLVQKHGHNWTEISGHLTGKSAHKVRHRHDTLLKWIRANPGKPIRISSRRSDKTNIYHKYPEMWAYAEKLLCGGMPKSASTSLLQAKHPNMTGRRGKTKRSLIDEKLDEYFRGTYCTSMTGCRKFTSLPECSPKLISDVASFLELLGAKLNIPCDDDLDDDDSLEPEDRQILKGLRNFYRNVAEETPQPPFEHVYVDDITRTDSNINIDCSQPSDPSSTLISLPYDFVGPHVEVGEPTNPVPVPEVFPPRKPAHPLFGDLKYLCPPNLATLVGLRSILLGKRKLVESISEFATDPILSNINDKSDESFQRASQLWDDRLMCLFALPNMLSKMKPTPVPEDSEGDERPGTSRLPPLRGVSPESDCMDTGPGSSTSGGLNIDNTLTSEDGTVRIITKRQRGGATKRKPVRKGGAPTKKRAKTS